MYPYPFSLSMYQWNKWKGHCIVASRTTIHNNVVFSKRTKFRVETNNRSQELQSFWWFSTITTTATYHIIMTLYLTQWNDRDDNKVESKSKPADITIVTRSISFVNQERQVRREERGIGTRKCLNAHCRVLFCRSCHIQYGHIMSRPSRPSWWWFGFHLSLTLSSCQACSEKIFVFLYLSQSSQQPCWLKLQSPSQSLKWYFIMLSVPMFRQTFFYNQRPL